MTILGLSSPKQTRGLLQQPFQKLAKELLMAELVLLQAPLIQTATMESEKALQTPTPAAQEEGKPNAFTQPRLSQRDHDHDDDIGTEVVTRLRVGT